MILKVFEPYRKEKKLAQITLEQAPLFEPSVPWKEYMNLDLPFEEWLKVEPPYDNNLSSVFTCTKAHIRI